jgi:hypothetical protein
MARPAIIIARLQGPRGEVPSGTPNIFYFQAQRRNPAEPLQTLLQRKRGVARVLGLQGAPRPSRPSKPSRHSGPLRASVDNYHTRPRRKATPFPNLEGEYHFQLSIFNFQLYIG